MFEDYVAAARRESARLREAEGAQVVVALTHLRWRNDERLARECAGAVQRASARQVVHQHVCVVPSNPSSRPPACPPARPPARPLAVAAAPALGRLVGVL